MAIEWLSQIIDGMSKPFKWWVVVAPWEQGLRVRLGKTAARLDPGIHLKVPFLDRIYCQSVRLRTIHNTSLTCTTRDGFCVTVSFACSFSVEDIVEFYNAASTPEINISTFAAARIVEMVSQLDKSQLNLNQIGSIELPVGLVRGLSRVVMKITSFAICRTLRLIGTEYSTGSGLFNIEDQTGERK